MMRFIGDLCICGLKDHHNPNSAVFPIIFPKHAQNERG